jgi:alpha-D-xyloside xylohydrolase
MSLPFDLDAFVRDYQRPLQLVQKIARVETDRFGATLFGATTQFQRKYRDRYGTAVEVGVPGARGDEFVMRLEFCAPEILRFRFTPGGMLPANRTPMVVNDFADRDFLVTIQRTETTLILMTSALIVTLQLDPWRMTIRDHAGQKLYETIPAAVFQHPPTGESHRDGASITDAWPWFFRDLYPLGFVRDDATGLAQTFDTAVLNHDEHLYGFGEKYSTLDKRGQMINLWHANATGNTWQLSYKNVPFFMSSRGFGLFINSAYPIRYHLGDLSHTRYSLHLQHNLLDYYFIYGPTYKQILPRYTSITGQPGLPPLWSFGLWMSRMSYRAQDQVEEIARQLREHDVPCDVIHIDTDWFKNPWVNDLQFSRERFPDPAAMIAKLRAQGFRLTLWQLPYIGTESEFYAEGVARGFFARRDDGSPRHVDGFFGPAAVIDYSNPDAVKWIQSKFEPLFAMGVAAIKTDFGEGAPPDAHYATRDGLEMHNLYPFLYNQAIFEKTIECTGDGIVWGRSVYAGSQRFPMHWGGDPASLWEDLGNLWHGGLGLGLCGFPFWSVDIGGFAGTPSPELYIRWAQAGLFVSHPRAHGPIHREPWAFGEQAEKIFRQYAKLRYRLMPYVWSTANTSVRTSQPVMRPLLLDWQNDPTTATIDDQFLFGEWILVAPILDERDQRQVYLPRGKWFDYWSGKILIGPQWLTVHAPLDVLPLFIRGGAILPLAPEMAHTGAKAWNPVTLDIYPHGKSAFTLFDGAEQITFECEEQTDGAMIRISPSQRRFDLQVHHAHGVATATVETGGAAVVLSVDF